MSRIALVVLLAALDAGSAAAEPAKLARLAEKAARGPESDKARARVDRELRKLVGKKPPPLITLVNNWTDERLAVEARPDVVVPAAVLDRFLRCHFTSETAAMDPRLPQLLVKAVDFRLAEVPTAKLRDHMQSLAAGGVGHYPISGFVHIDTAAVRAWEGR